MSPYENYNVYLFKDGDFYYNHDIITTVNVKLIKNNPKNLNLFVTTSISDFLEETKDDNKTMLYRRVRYILLKAVQHGCDSFVMG